MAMKTASPWWFSALFAAGLLLLFMGERPFDELGAVRLILSGLGTLLVLGISALRVWTFAATTGERRAVERVLLFCHAGVLVSLVLYLTTTDWGHGVLGIDPSDSKAFDRFQIPMTILWSIGMLISLVPLLMVELSLGAARRNKFIPGDLDASDTKQEAVESFRVREISNSGLSIALAAAFLMVTCNVAEQRNIRRDVSYFKTSSPGSATVNLTKNFAQPVKVVLFFPPVNEVKNEVRGYFDSLEAATGNVLIEEHDQLLSPALAKKYRVNNNGTVVLVVPDGKKPAEGKEPGEQHQSFKLTIDEKATKRRAARTELRELDGKVNTALMKLSREKRVAYMTVGHGELNDSNSNWAKSGGRIFARRGGLKTNLIKSALRNLNFQVKDLGLAQGLANEVPDDATVVLILGPQAPLLDEEYAALDRYLARGGRVLIALDPLSSATLGSLEGRLGIRYNPTPLTDDKLHMRYLGRPSDRRLIITDRFSSHASITTLTRAARAGILLVNAGSLEEARFTGGGKPKRTMVIRSRSTTFADTDNDFKLTKGTEKAKQYNLVAAIENPDARPADQEEEGSGKSEGMRAMVFADVEIFSDYLQPPNQPPSVMFSDAIKWLGGEEHIAGEIVSEKDVYIEHTRNEDVLWFYSTLVGAPLIVLGFGLVFGWWRRQRMQRRAS
ncbi:MAG: GldG family protein [Proteobacteria bacterium]|nr:GldG family protein [Pseudomonadota bacterium]